MAKIDFEKGKITLMNLLQFVREIREKVLNGGGDAEPVSWGDVTGKPTTFTPATHTHPTSEITGLDAKISAIEARLDALELLE